MKIALVGVPGAGKTDLAGALQNGELGRRQTVGIIDSYVNSLGNQLDRPYGHFGNFLDNYQIVFERIKQEQRRDLGHFGEQEITITCGTLIETILYTQIYARSVLLGDPRAESISMNIARGDVSARLFAQMVWDTWRYDHVFVLPLPDDTETDGWSADMDADLVPALEQFFIPYEVLDANATTEERAQQVVHAIRRKGLAGVTVQPSEADERSVRPGDGDGEEVGNSPDPVSDLPDDS